MTVLSVDRADNWLVDTGSHQAENGGLSEFGKVRWLQHISAWHVCFPRPIFIAFIAQPVA